MQIIKSCVFLLQNSFLMLCMNSSVKFVIKITIKSTIQNIFIYYTFGDLVFQENFRSNNVQTLLLNLFYILVLTQFFNTHNTKIIFILNTNILAINGLILSNNLLYIFILLELFNLTNYLLLASNNNSEHNISNSIKYLIISIFSSIIILIGILYIYYNTGSFNINNIYICNIHKDQYWGNNLIIQGILCKLGKGIFYNYIRDVYSSLNITNLLYILIFPKLALIGLLINLNFQDYSLLVYFSVFSKWVLSISIHFVYKYKIFMIYSSLYNKSMIQLAILYYNNILLLFYQLIYFLILIAKFLLIQNKINYQFEQKGLLYTNKLVAIFLIICLLSLAG